eukprot:TRINITY_DN3861_c0_g2_i1.p1 TRINITY_DN3861_c0_g2~~TRINITY_DN3861_c0_g2_i1.p1  ORF type:complete len:224 (-),score=54.58 TRINITY_DN3861_c0_g2_i1:207-878(-)
MHTLLSLVLEALNADNGNSKKPKTMDKTTQAYVEDILEDYESLDTLAKDVSPFLISSGFAKSEEQVLAVLVKVLKNSQLKPEEKLLDAPFQIEQEKEEEVPVYIEVLERPVEKTDDGGLSECILLTHDPDPRVRLRTLREMCPCHVKRDVETLWKRILEMTDDPDPNVRYQVLHDLCDGSPSHMEDVVIKALERMHNDPDKKVRRRVHQVLSNYRRCGKWNIM